MLVDMDGVLVNCKRSVYVAYRQACLEDGIVLNKDAFQKCLWGKTWKDGLGSLFPNLDELSLLRIKLRKDNYFLQCKVEVNEPVVEMVIDLSRMGYPIHIVSSASYEANEHKLRFLPACLSMVPRTHSAPKGMEVFWRQFMDRHNYKFAVLFDDDRRVCEAAKAQGIKAICIDSLEDL